MGSPLQSILGLVLATMGAIRVVGDLRWRLRAERVTGVLVGLRPLSRLACIAVYQYSDALGQAKVAGCRIGAIAVRDHPAGSRVRLLVLPADPQHVREADSWTREILAGVVLLVGLGTLWGLSLLGSGQPVVPVVLACSAVIGLFVPSSVQRGTGSDLGASPGNATAPMQSVAAVLAQRRNYKGLVSGLVSVVIALGLASAMVAASMDTLRLELRGLHAAGTVVGFKREQWQTGKADAYYPMVRFSTETGASIEFKDRVGHYHPEYLQGVAVNVLYLPRNPATAIIDRGIWQEMGGLIGWLAVLAVWATAGIVGIARWLRQEVLRGRARLSTPAPFALPTDAAGQQAGTWSVPGRNEPADGSGLRSRRDRYIFGAIALGVADGVLTWADSGAVDSRIYIAGMLMFFLVLFGALVMMLLEQLHTAASRVVGPSRTLQALTRMEIAIWAAILTIEGASIGLLLIDRLGRL